MKRLLIVATAFFLAAQARADNVEALVVATCGTVPVTYAVGSTRQVTVDTNGQVCQ